MNTAIGNSPSDRALVQIIEEETICILDEDVYISDLTSDELSESESPEVRALGNCQWRYKTKEATKRRKLTIGFHHGQLQVLPPTWAFLKMNCKKLVHNLYVCNKGEWIPPLAMLSHNDVAH